MKKSHPPNPPPKLQTTTILDLGDKSQADLHVPAHFHLNYFFLWQRQPQITKLNLHLDGPHASAQLIGLISLKGNKILNINTAIIHHAPHTQGRTLIKGILTNRAQTRLHSLIKIHKSAQHSKDLLTERFLLLSSQAKSHFTPSLEIAAHQVTVTHAATAHPLDLHQLYYLKTRGLPETSAQALLIDGFLQEVTNLFPQKLQRLISKKLPSPSHL